MFSPLWSSSFRPMATVRPFWVRLVEETLPAARLSMLTRLCSYIDNTDAIELQSLGQELAYVKSAFPTLAGFSIWAAGAFDTTYVLTVTPNADGSDQPLWTDAGKWYISCLAMRTRSDWFNFESYSQPSVRTDHNELMLCVSFIRYAPRCGLCFSRMDVVFD